MQARAEPSINVNDSSLVHILTKLLDKIAELKAKYPATAADSPDKEHANKLFNALETLLSGLKNNFLPYFDEQKIPGVLDLVGLGWQAWGLYNAMNALGAVVNTPELNRFLQISKVIAAEIPALELKPDTPAITQVLALWKSGAFRHALDNHPLDEAILSKIARIADERVNYFAETYDKLMVSDKGSVTKLLYDLQYFLFNADIDAAIPADVKIDNQLFYQRAFSKVDMKLWTFAVTHPMIFELIEFMIQYMPQLPAQFQQLVPFLNPKALAIDIPMTNIKIEHVEDGGAPFRYRMKNQHKIFNIEQRYNENLPWSLASLTGLFLDEVHRYFEKNQASKPVIEVRVRAARLQQLRDAIITTTQQSSAEHRAQSKQSLVVASREPVSYIINLDKAIKMTQTLKMDNEALQAALTAKQKAILEAPVSVLIGEHPHFIQALKEDAAQQLDQSYLKSPLPDKVIAAYASGELYPDSITGVISQSLQQQIEELQITGEVLSDQLKSYQQQRLTQLKLWQVDTLEDHQQHLEKVQKALQCYQLELHALTIKSFDKKLSIDEAVALTSKKIASMLQMIQAIDALLKQVADSSQLDASIQYLDEEHMVQTRLQETSQPIIKEAQDLLNHLKRCRQEQQITLHDLKHQQEKEQAQVLFAETMRAANPLQLRQLIATNELQLVRMQQKIAEQATQLLSERDALVREQQIQFQWHETLAHQERALKHAETADAMLFQNMLSLFSTHGFTTLNASMNFSHLHQQKLFAPLKLEVEESLRHKQLEYRQNEDVLSQHTAYREFFTQVLTLIDASAANHFPFSEIDELPVHAELKGFNGLLTLLGKEKKMGWAKARSQQDDLFVRNNLTQADYELLKQTIRNAIQSKIADFDAFDSKVQQDAHPLTKLEALLTQISKFEDMTALIVHEQEKMKAEIEATQQHISPDLPQRMAQAEKRHQENEHLIATRNQLEKQQLLLKTTVTLLDEIASINLLCEQFEVEENTLFKDTAIKKSTAISDALKALKAKLAMFEQSMNLHGENHPLQLATITPLLDAIQKRLSADLHRKMNLPSVQESIQRVKEALQEFKQPMINENQSARIAHWQAFSHSLNTAKSSINQLTQHANLLEESANIPEIKTIIAETALLQEAIYQAGASMMDELIDALKNYHEQTSRALSQLNESQPTTDLNPIRMQLSQLPTTHELECLAPVPGYAEKLASIALLQQQIAAELNAYPKLVQQRQERETLVQNVLIPKLDVYIDNRASSYQLKDFFSATDKNERMLYVETLKTLLLKYQATGDSDALLASIRENKGRFPGIYLNCTLNQIEIQIRQTVHAHSVPEPDKVHSSEEILRILNGRADNDRAVVAIKKLYQDIEKLRSFGESLTSTDSTDAIAIAALATGLTHDLNQFVLHNQDKALSSAEYSEFKETFSARLHTHTDIMAKHNSFWKPFFVNVALGICTLGIALGVQLIYSKVTTGRSTLFCANTCEDELIAPMDEDIDDITDVKLSR